MRWRALSSVALLALTASCVSGRWTRTHRHEAIAPERIAAAEVGRSDLAQCLTLFGAPLYVWELPDGAFSLAYGWSQDRNLGGTVTIPLSRIFSPSYSYDDVGADLYGLVLLFDRGTTLRPLRKGYLRDIAPELLRRRPADVEEGGVSPPGGA